MSEVEKTYNQNKYGHIEHDIFAAYFSGHSIKDIGKMFDIPLNTVYTLKRRHNWEERKRALNEKVTVSIDEDLIVKKGDMVKMASVLVNQAGTYLMEQASKKKLDFKVTEWINLVKLYEHLVDDAHKTSGSILDEDVLMRIAEDLTPPERAMVFSLLDKMEAQVRKDNQEKETALNVAN